MNKHCHCLIEREKDREEKRWRVSGLLCSHYPNICPSVSVCSSRLWDACVWRGESGSVCRRKADSCGQKVVCAGDPAPTLWSRCRLWVFMPPPTHTHTHSHTTTQCCSVLLHMARMRPVWVNAVLNSVSLLKLHYHSKVCSL